jgi:hypothetical protein
LLKFDHWLTEPLDTLADKVSVIEDDLHALKQAGETFISRLGKPAMIMGIDFPDVWCAIDHLSTVVQEKLDASNIPSGFQDLLDVITRVQQQCLAVQDLPALFRQLQEKIHKHESRFEFIQPILLSSHNAVQTVGNLSAQISAWEQRLSVIETANVVPLRSTTARVDPWTQNFAPLPDTGTMSNNVNPPPPDGDARLKTLEHALRALEKRVVGEGTKIGRFLFQSREDLRMWMLTNVPNNRFGLFLDAMSIFDFLAQPHLDNQDNMAQLYNSQKNSFETTYESRVVSSMQNLFPNLFGKSLADGMDTSQALPGLLTVEKWNNNGVMGLQLQVEHELPNVEYQFRQAIGTTFEDYPEARDLALELLYRSKKFVVDLCNFIQRDYDFWHHKGYTKKEAWELTCLSVRRIFEDIHVVRVSGRDCRDISQPQLTATQIVWATIRTHTVMDEYSRRNFFEHPSISAVIARHLASNHLRPDSSPDDRLKKAEASLTKLSAWMDHLESCLARVESKKDIPPPRNKKNRRKNKATPEEAA